MIKTDRLLAHIIQEENGGWYIRLFWRDTLNFAAPAEVRTWAAIMPQDEYRYADQAEAWCIANLVEVGMIVYRRDFKKYLQRKKMGKRTWHD